MATLIPLIIGKHCVGHIIQRGPKGVEAFDANERTLGTFATAAEAVAALVAAASAPEDAA